jgi:hypothetical protein
MMASEDVELQTDNEAEPVAKITVEYVEYRDPECPVHYGLLPEEVEGF